MNYEIKPVFIFSLPRSGSTLLQRMLSTHDSVDSVSETWLLLPFIYATRKEGIYAEYSHIGVHTALKDFCEELPNGYDDYFQAVGLSIKALYKNVAKNDVKYFIDKTPRYALVSNEISRMFPDGKYIYLWRNPLAIIASMIETWGGGTWNIFKYKVDLFCGLSSMIESYTNNKSNSISIKYENLVSRESDIKNLFDYLDIEMNQDCLSSFSNIKFKGTLGDPTGIKKYNRLSDDSTDKWMKILSNPLRKAWCKYYLRWIGAERLGIMGYDLNQLIEQLDNTPNNLNMLGKDFLALLYGFLYCLVEPTVFRRKLKSLSDWRSVIKLS